MRQKWGESIGAGFSFGLVHLIAVIVVGGALFLVGSVFNTVIGILLGVLGVLFVAAVMSAAQTIFISAVYHNITGDPVEHFDQQMINNLFVHK
jgi:hypothetical protein